LVGDILDKRRPAIALLVALSGSVLLMGWSAQAFLFTTCMVIYSLAYGGLAALQEPIRAEYFGTKAFATIQGVSRSVMTAGTFMGPMLAGRLLRVYEKLHRGLRDLRGDEFSVAVFHVLGQVAAPEQLTAKKLSRPSPPPPKQDREI
jgi:MFS family permease